MAPADDQPHVTLPDGSTFDLCIERLASVPGDGFYPLETGNWAGGLDSWNEWKSYIKGTYAKGKDISDRNIRQGIIRTIQAQPIWPIYDFARQKITTVQNPSQPQRKKAP